jgi:nitroreductase
MNFFDVIRTRRSVRSYRPDPIPEDVLDRVLEAVRIALSASNRQPWRFIIVKDEATKQKIITACYGQSWVAEAPVIVVACGNDKIFDHGNNHGGYMGNMSMIVDTSIAFTHLILAARVEGLGTCWIGWFSNDQLKKILNVPGDWDIVALTPLGFPSVGDAAFREPGSRKPLKKIVSTDRF